MTDLIYHVGGRRGGITYDQDNWRVQTETFAITTVPNYVVTPFGMNTFDQNDLTGGTLKRVDLFLSMTYGLTVELECTNTAPGFYDYWIGGSPNPMVNEGYDFIKILYDLPGHVNELVAEKRHYFPIVHGQMTEFDGVHDYGGTSGVTSVQSGVDASVLVASIVDPAYLEFWNGQTGHAGHSGIGLAYWKAPNIGILTGFGQQDSQHQIDVTGGTLTVQYWYQIP